MEAKLIIAEDDAQFHSIITQDALGSLMKAVSSLVKQEKQEQNKFKDWVSSGTDDWMYAVYTLNNQHLPADTGMIRLFIHSFLEHYNVLAQRFDVVDWLQQLDTAWQQRTGTDSMLLQKILYTLIKVQIFFEHDLNNCETYLEIGHLFKFISRELTTAGADKEALSQAFTGINFLAAGELSKAIEFSREAIGIYESLLPAELQGLLALHLKLLHDARAKGMSVSREMFITAERLLVIQLRAGQPFESGIGELIYRTIFDFSSLTILKLLYLRVKGTESHRPSDFDTEKWPDIRLQYQLVWNDPFPSWLQNVLLTPGAMVTAWENFNYDLRVKNIRPEVKFNDLSLLHNKFTEAVPLGNSFLREKNKNDIILELKHELTHIYSLFGRIGISLNALRVMMAELEKILLLTHYQLEHNDPILVNSIVRNYVQEGRPAELIRPDLYALLYGESSALLEQKIRTVEQIWTPWFEGIAVFGELTDDPTLDPNVESPISTVLKNLVDKDLGQFVNNREELITEHMKHLHEMEAIQADALEKDGVFRLWTYLIEHHRKYLPGYLVVRKLVSIWRSKSKRALRGDLAYRLMLHVTRFSQIDILPDLSLPLEEFKLAASELHMSWLAQLSEISEDDLDTFLENQDTQKVKSCGWINGRLSFDTAAMAAEQQVFEENLLSRTKAYIGEMTQRITKNLVDTAAAEMIQRKMLLVAEAFSRSPVLLDNQESIRAFDHHSVLALGEASCPFWLVREDHTFIAYIRTRDKDVQEQTAHYSMCAFRISPEDFAYLEKEGLDTGKTRIQVIRTIVLGGREDKLANGHHFIVFKFGSWIRIHAAGIVQGRDIPTDTLNLLKERFKDDKHTDLREYLIGPGHPCAKRTLKYLELNSWNEVPFEQLKIDASTWVRQVKYVCEDVLREGNETLEEISLALMKWAVADKDLAAQLFASGLKAIDQPGFSSFDCLKLFYQSAHLPVQNDESADAAKKIHQTYPQLCYFSNTGWDVLNP